VVAFLAAPLRNLQLFLVGAVGLEPTLYGF
jgi:hypothetical protein